MNRALTFPSLFIAFMLQSCTQCNVKKPGFDNKPLTVTVVLCDLTKSIDTTAIDNIAEHAVQLYSNAPDRTEVYYYGIGPNDYNEYIGKQCKKLPLRENDSQRNKRLAQIAIDDSLLLLEIKNLYNSKHYQQTCITHALKTASDLLKEKSDELENATLNIVVLSDMMEDCNHYLLGKLQMTSLEKMKQTLETISAAPSTDINLKRLKIHLYLISESKSVAMKLSRHELESSWRLLLTKYGYEQNDELVKFSWQMIPDNLISSN